MDTTVKPQPPILDAIGIIAADMAAALGFYRRLGLDIPDPDGPHTEVELPSGLRLMFDTAELAAQLEPGRVPPSGGHRVAIAFRCADASHVDALYAELAETGCGHTPPYDAPWGQRYASLRDPDGNAVDLYAWQD